KVRRADVPIVGDAKVVLNQLAAKVESRLEQEPGSAERPDWMETIRSWQQDYAVGYEQDPAGPIKPQYVIEELYRITGGDAIVVAGVGQHQ
ncbi:MAG: acetolactate synthase large subunit, partial [Akkermansiaceae bacterium]|nr:acetolactate synthase large subunit [Akkermansiaceae bacterium]